MRLVLVGGCWIILFILGLVVRIGLRLLVVSFIVGVLFVLTVICGIRISFFRLPDCLIIFMLAFVSTF